MRLSCTTGVTCSDGIRLPTYLDISAFSNCCNRKVLITESKNLVSDLLLDKIKGYQKESKMIIQSLFLLSPERLKLDVSKLLMVD